MASEPKIFIVESLKLSDERKGHFEGQILQQFLRLSDKECRYYYIRTKRELPMVMKEFAKSGFRYLHISAHANRSSMATTLNSLSFQELGGIVRPYLDGRRVFLSACEMATMALARELIPKSKCHSVMGPRTTVAFGDAALLWAAFYHLMFRTDPARMSKKSLRMHAQQATTLLGVPMNLFVRTKKESDAIERISLTPVPPDGEAKTR